MVRVLFNCYQPLPVLTKFSRLADEWSVNAAFHNVCGPTEISILNTVHLHKAGGELSIGTPNPNTNVYILDEDENPVPIGESGYMWAGGQGVSRGYINLPELTARRFKDDKFTRDGYVTCSDHYILRTHTLI
jgi:non-ribosomal peptide synthetase component F